MNMKEQIHTLSEEMIANLGRLVAIDSQLGTPEEGKPFGAGGDADGRQGNTSFRYQLLLCFD